VDKKDKDIKVLILVLDIKKEPYISIKKEGIDKTWNSEDYPNIDTYFYYGDNDKNEIIGDEILTDIPDTFENIGRKTIKALEIIDENLDYDYIFRTNTSSYICKELLMDKIKSIQDENLYAGKFLLKRTKDDMRVASGAGYFLSKNKVKYIIQNQDKWDHTIEDDIALGELLGEEPLYLNRIDLRHLDKIYEFKLYYHFRCKTIKRQGYIGEEGYMDSKEDIKIMQEVHKKINKKINRYRMMNKGIY
jgi:hypothetical protein